MNPDLEIARAAKLRPIHEIAARLGIPDDAVEPYGRHKAKIGAGFHRHLGAAFRRRAGAGDGDQPNARGGGKDHNDRWARGCAEPDRQTARRSAFGNRAWGRVSG